MHLYVHTVDQTQCSMIQEDKSFISLAVVNVFLLFCILFNPDDVLFYGKCSIKNHF